MDHSITWKYIVEKMRDEYGISPESEEKLSFAEIEAYMNKIWDDYIDTPQNCH